MIFPGALANRGVLGLVGWRVFSPVKRPGIASRGRQEKNTPTDAPGCYNATRSVGPPLGIRQVTSSKTMMS